MPNEWPSWAGRPGGLTEHGAKAVALLASSDRSWMIALGLLPASSCPQPDTFEILSNSFPRSIHTAEVYSAHVAPGCAIEPAHAPVGQPDPLFPSAATETLSFSPAKADAAAATAIGAEGLGKWDRAIGPLRERLNKILCGGTTATCGIRGPSSLQAATAGRPPQLRGGVSSAAEASGALLLQYADGWPMHRVGWGRATGSDITALSRLVAQPYEITVRPPYLSSLETPALRQRMAKALNDDQPARVTVIVGHDGTIASLAGQLGLHWTVPGFAPDYPSFGSGLGFAKLRAPDGREYFTAFYRGQSLEQIRALSTDGPREVYFKKLQLGCRAVALVGACTPAEFEKMLLAAPIE
jgi:4-phytase/acid phosphatase